MENFWSTCLWKTSVHETKVICKLCNAHYEYNKFKWLWTCGNTSADWINFKLLFMFSFNCNVSWYVSYRISCIVICTESAQYSIVPALQKTGYLVCFCCFKYSARKSGKKTLFFKKDKTDMIYWIFFQSTYQIYYVLVNLNVSLNHIIINLFKCVIYGLYLCS